MKKWRSRIKMHRERRGSGWRSVEAPRELSSALAANATTPVLVDCLTLWLSNLMLAGADVDREIEAFGKSFGGDESAGGSGRQ